MANQVLDYGLEFVLDVPSGTLRAPAYPEECSYVRICDKAGAEIAYWIYDEWAEDPQLVMGAILGATQVAGLT